MPYDERLAARVRAAIGRPEVAEKKMFGGLCVLVNGNMAAGVVGDGLVVRLGTARGPEAARRAHARACDFTGTPMKSIVMVDAAGLRTRRAARGVGARRARLRGLVAAAALTTRPRAVRWCRARAAR
jgi:hypothetical protein